MKKKWWIILIIFVVIFLLLWLGAYLWYHPYWRWHSNPYFDKDAICVWLDGWECPQRFLEENNIKFTLMGVIEELPEWWEEAGCVEKTVKIPCSQYLN